MWKTVGLGLASRTRLPDVPQPQERNFDGRTSAREADRVVPGR
jgi:hypothetical protein